MRTPQCAQHVGRKAREPEQEEREPEPRPELGPVRVVQRGCRRCRAGDAEDDREDCKALAPAGALAEYALPREHQHEQPCCKRGLDDGERREQQREHLQWPAKQRERCAKQPAPAPH